MCGHELQQGRDIPLAQSIKRAICSGGHTHVGNLAANQDGVNELKSHNCTWKDNAQFGVKRNAVEDVLVSRVEARSCTNVRTPVGSASAQAIGGPQPERSRGVLRWTYR